MRFLFLSLALTVAPAALACGGQSCGAACPMAAAEAAATADAASNFSADSVAEADGEKLTLAVSGVHCPVSAGQVRAALLKLDGINAVAVDTAGKTDIAFDAEKTSKDAIVSAFDDIHGFEAAVPASTDG